MYATLMEKMSIRIWYNVHEDEAKKGKWKVPYAYEILILLCKLIDLVTRPNLYVNWMWPKYKSN